MTRDPLPPQGRSQLMGRVRGRDTKPELVVRSLVHRLGYRFRLHRRDLPGSPGLVLPRHRKAILVHGCFWHRHPGCRKASTPTANREFWLAKFAANVARDERDRLALERLGWRTVVVWECETKDLEPLGDRLRAFLSGDADPTP